MKHIVSLLVLVAVLLSACNGGGDPGQTGEGVSFEASAGPYDFYRKTEFTADSLKTTGAAPDTVIFTIGEFNQPVYYAVQISADSTSGSTNGTSLVQWSAGSSSSDWVNLDTAVIDGVTTRGMETGSIDGGRLRVFTTGAATAQRTELRVVSVVAAKNQ